MTNPEEITIRIASMGMIVELGRTPHSRLRWQCPGLDIYVLGAMPAHLYPVACNVAMNEAITRGIRAATLRRVGR